MVKGFKIEAQVLQEIVNYLAQNPYAEVFEVIQNIQRTSIRIDQENFLLREELHGVLLDYLARKQYNHVARFIAAVANATRTEVEGNTAPAITEVTPTAAPQQ